jgi:hypothetical protein
LEDGRLAGRPDLQQVVRDIVTELAPRIEAVETEFANKYGWTRNRELNAANQSAEEIMIEEEALEDYRNLKLLSYSHCRGCVSAKRTKSY